MEFSDSDIKIQLKNFSNHAFTIRESLGFSQPILIAQLNLNSTIFLHYCAYDVGPCLA